MTRRSVRRTLAAVAFAAAALLALSGAVCVAATFQDTAAAVASVKRELGGKWATIMVVNQCAVAWLCALLVRLVAVAVF